MVFAVAITALSTLSVNAQDATMWKIDKSHTSVNFSINHFFSSVPGKFTDFDGMIHFDPNNLKGSKADFSVSINSVNTDDTKRDKHLQSEDFFDAKTYPKMVFQSTKFEKKSDKKYLIHGKLTIKDVTKNVALPMKITGEMEHPMMKGTIILGVVIDTTIDRTDYEVGTGDWAATMVVDDEVKIHIPMELNRMK
ncbi:polyisoprenoid-binding protein YceI [Mesonia algae]|uniref:Polyisoprenoid-binding protein YceI n=2 Tax=Mesonia algae TaxID=213248 RepID=A0A2W7IRX2_9FLAO|nr:polyisoprenoid-binding protein YceI [Mesonia algae]